MKADTSIQSVPNVLASDENKKDETSSAEDVNQDKKPVRVNPQTANHQSNNSTESGVVVDKARVREIKQAISEDNFKVNADIVADRLLETAQELIKPKPKKKKSKS